MKELNRWASLLGACAVLSGASVLAQAARTTTAPTPANPTAGADTGSVNLPGQPRWLGSVHLPVRVMADGKPLPAGTYRVRLTGEHAKNDVVGQNEQLERWVEFVQDGAVKGRALAPVVPSQSARQVAKDGLPARGAARVERLKENDYYRVWFNYRGDQVMVYLPIA